uniref:Cytochrome c oxidase subunit 2 n=1 Tax=Schyzocotyle acheilognathi TaxID=135513 RepID=A0A172WXY4_SCHAC|nr:cytochrome c oxidase subunit 2 [Schyzocotyle acheilognathi]
MNFSLLYYDIICFVVALCVFIVVFVFFMLYWDVTGGGTVNFGSDNQSIELIWTVIPTVVVLILCALNVNFLTGGLDNLSDNTICVVGRQWYWSYDYAEGSYDSYPCKDGFHVDKPIRLEYGKAYRFLITSSDVIHSFAVPSLGLKMDAIPGRLNQLLYLPDRYGIFVGYCSELCGAGHSYMPIVIEVVHG